MKINPELVFLIKKHDDTICHHRQSSSYHRHHPSSLMFIQSHSSTTSYCVYIDSLIAMQAIFIDHKISETTHHEFWQKIIHSQHCRSSVCLSFCLDERLCGQTPLQWCTNHNWVDLLEFITLMLNLLVWYRLKFITRSFWINFSHEIIPKDCTYLYLQSSNHVLIPPSTSTNPGIGMDAGVQATWFLTSAEAGTECQNVLQVCTKGGQ